MRQAFIITTAAIVELLAALILPAPLSWVLLLVGLSTGMVAVAVALRRPALFCKREDGSLPAWTWVAFGPWRAGTAIAAALVRRHFVPYSEVLPGWWVGVWPHHEVLAHPWDAVVDVTCELPRRHRGPAYLCLATWDQTPPSQAALQRGADFMLQHRRAGGSVLVHCAAGRGRSVTVLCAALVHAGEASDWRSALAMVQRARPQARLTWSQQAALDRWTAAQAAQLT